MSEVKLVDQWVGSNDYQEATEVARQAAVSLQEAQTMLTELDLKCRLEQILGITCQSK